MFTHRFRAAGRIRVLRVHDTPHEAPLGVLLAFPGTGQTADRLADQLVPLDWCAAGWTVAFLGSLGPDRTWSPRCAGGPDLPAALYAIEWLRARWPGLPIWLGGHSGGACFAHNAAAVAAERGVWPDGGLIANAGWPWRWLVRYWRARTLRPYPVCCRGGADDPLVSPDVAASGEPYLGRVPVRSVVVPGVRHRWAASDDAALRAWMRRPAVSLGIAGG